MANSIQADPERATAEPVTILLVDDDPDCRMLVRDAISTCAVSNAVYEAGDAQEALDFLERNGDFRTAPRPGLIYLDIEMPGMDGQALLRRIKADPDLRDIPVVMMTGVRDREQVRLAAANGANSYTIKPTNAEHFLSSVRASAHYWLTIHQYPFANPGKYRTSDAEEGTCVDGKAQIAHH